MKKVLITGGATGIGKATAIAFAQKGYDVYITYNKTVPDYDGVTAINAISAMLMRSKVSLRIFLRWIFL